MSVYYNEFDPQMAAWLRELISRGLLPDGVVDERSIWDVKPYDLRGFTQCHFFAGIGGWPAALKWLVGWPDDRPVWTGSAPCQPFSGAGKGLGFADERHAWPAFYHLIGECRPERVYGEQVANRLDWLDLVSGDLEAAGYATWAVDLCAAGCGSPHIRQRLFWTAYDTGYGATGLAHTHYEGSQGRSVSGNSTDQRPVGANGVADGLADTSREREDRSGNVGQGRGTEHSDSGGAPEGLAYPHGSIAELLTRTGTESGAEEVAGTYSEFDGCGELVEGLIGTRACDGHWSLADWLLGTDGNWRPAESGTFPLADGFPERVGLLRGYGNAIVPQLAAEFIKAAEEGWNQ